MNIADKQTAYELMGMANDPKFKRSVLEPCNEWLKTEITRLTNTRETVETHQAQGRCQAIQSFLDAFASASKVYDRFEQGEGK